MTTLDANETRELRQLVERASATAHGTDGRGGGRILLSRPSGLQPLAVLVAPVIPRSATTRPRAPMVAVFISDPERGMLAPGEMLRRVFNLTIAESRLAVRIAQGKTLEKSSAELDISIHTARTQLKSVFSKTGVGRQAELVRLLLTLAAPVRDR